MGGSGTGARWFKAGISDAPANTAGGFDIGMLDGPATTVGGLDDITLGVLKQ